MHTQAADTPPRHCFPGLHFPEDQPPHPPLPPCSEMVPARANLPQTQMIRTIGHGGNTGVNCPLPACASFRTYWKHHRPPHPPRLPHHPDLPCPSCLPHLHHLGHTGLTMGRCGPACLASPAVSSCCCRPVLASVPGADPCGSAKCPPFPGVRVTRSPRSTGASTASAQERGLGQGSSGVCTQRDATAARGAGGKESTHFGVHRFGVR